MNFYDTITGMGYFKEKSEVEDVIHLTQKHVLKDFSMTIHIFFYMKDKKILGTLQANTLFYDLDDMCLAYKLFQQMEEDVKYLANRAKFDII